MEECKGIDKECKGIDEECKGIDEEGVREIVGQVLQDLCRNWGSSYREDFRQLVNQVCDPLVYCGNDFITLQQLAYRVGELEQLVEELILRDPAYALTSNNQNLRKTAERLLKEKQK